MKSLVIAQSRSPIGRCICAGKPTSPRRPGAMLLTDDAAARLAADSLGIAAHGTLGLILRSVRRKLRTAEQALQLLADVPDRSSLHIRPALLEQTLRRAEAEWLGPK